MWKRDALILFTTGSFSWAEKKAVGKFCETESNSEYNYCSNEKGEKKRPNLCKTELNTPALQFMVKLGTALAVCLCDACHCCQHALFSPL